MKPGHCQKCGKKLTDPLSLAIGLGPECRGDSGARKTYRAKVAKHAGRAYVAVGQSASVQGHVVAHTSDGWTWDGKPLDEGWLRRYFPGLVANESVSLHTSVQLSFAAGEKHT